MTLHQNSIEKYKTDHLILLVGSNPLPNWVAGRILCPEGTIHLVHSEDTKEIARTRLKKAFGKKRCKFYSLGYEQSNSKKIYDTIRYILEHDIPPKIKVGLNYTGGTKTMSVHAYEAAIFFDDKRIICSYLDAWTLNMVIIGKMGESDNSYYIGQHREVKIEVKQLMDLHGINLQIGSPVENLSPLVKTCPSMVKIYNRSEFRDAWINYFQGERRLDHHHNENDSSYRNRINSITLPHEDGINGPKNLIQRSKTDLRKFDLQSIAQAYDLNVVDVADWFHGLWLEDYVLQILQLLQSTCGLNQPGKNFEAKNPQDPDNPKFEFDVAVTRGYQLFAFSCTTSNKKSRCKLKLFEAYTRAKQMGGDETRTALVCGYDFPDRLQEDLSYEFDAGGRIKVFGLPELLNLKEYIEKWFKVIETKQKQRR